MPQDDGACNHLAGFKVPTIALPSTSGGFVNLAAQKERTVVYCYPMTGLPGVQLPAGWDQIPGARGCTPESCGFRERFQRFGELGVTIYGLSTQSTDYQREAVQRLKLPFAILSDSGLRLTRALRLPTFIADGKELIKRLTLIIRDGVIEKVFYPVFPPDRHAEEVVAWLEQVPPRTK